MSEYVHANSTALPAHCRRRTVFGYDIPAGPLYDPLSIATTLRLVNAIEYLGTEWTIENLVSAPVLVSGAPSELLARSVEHHLQRVLMELSACCLRCQSGGTTARRIGHR